MLLPVGGVPDARTKLLPSANEPIRYSADVVVAGGVVQASLFDDKRMAPLPPATQYRLNESPVLLFVTVYVPELFVTVAVPECTEVSCPFRRGVVSSSHDVVPNCVRFHGEVGACPTVCVLLVCPIIIWCMELAHEAPPLSDRDRSRGFRSFPAIWRGTRRLPNELCAAVSFRSKRGDRRAGPGADRADGGAARRNPRGR